jgi:E3 ubiquitin-protein ligase RNF13
VISDGNTTVEIFFDVELGFGSPVPYEGVVGRLVLANPEDACKGPIDPPPVAKNATSDKWFALVRRYPCPFQQKVKNAMESGYDAVIIYNVESMLKRNHSLIRLPPLDAASGIPAVLVSHDDGVTLRDNYLYDKGFYIVVSPDMQFNLTAYLLPFAVVIGICMLVMISFMVIKCYRDRRRSRRHRLSSKHLKKIPTTKFKKGDHYDTCAICLEEYVDGEKLRLLPCGHVYHKNCIDPWLTKNRRVCPVCKGKVVLPGMSDISDTDDESPTTPRPTATERTPLLPGSRPPRRQRRNRGTRSQRSGTDSAGGRARSSTSPDSLGVVHPPTLLSPNTTTHDGSVSSLVVSADIEPSTHPPSPSHMSVNFGGDHELLSETTDGDEPTPAIVLGAENQLVSLTSNLERQRRPDLNVVNV